MNRVGLSEITRPEYVPLEQVDRVYSGGSLPGFSAFVNIETNVPPPETLAIAVEPIREDYMHLALSEGFDWTIILAQASRMTGAERFYLVAFRSQQAPDADVELLMEHDTRAHEVAKASPALLHYFGGATDENRHALSFCLWTDREAALAATSHSAHKAASALTRSPRDGAAHTKPMYSSFSLEKYYVSLVDGVPKFEPYEL